MLVAIVPYSRWVERIQNSLRSPQKAVCNQGRRRRRGLGFLDSVGAGNSARLIDACVLSEYRPRRVKGGYPSVPVAHETMGIRLLFRTIRRRPLLH